MVGGQFFLDEAEQFLQRLHYQFSVGIPDRNGDACLMDIHAIILSAIREGAPFYRS